MLRISNLKLPINYTEKKLRTAAAAALRIPEDAILKLTLRKRSLDARKKAELHYVIAVDVSVLKEEQILKKNKKNTHISIAKDVTYRYPQSGETALTHRPVVVGSGPAGLFCGLVLARCGYRPLVLERGEDVDSRTKTVEAFWKNGTLNPQSNVQFGEGGAGTFSDGKLNTVVKDKDGRGRFVLETFVEAGADPDILYVNKPHIGTDVLKSVVKHIRQEIISLGGEVRFGTQMTDIEIHDGAVTGITINDREQIPCEVLVLAIGHSARDTFDLLTKKPLEMTAKSFAVGLRMEHPQAFINKTQYGTESPEYLGAADYKVTAKLSDGRGAYSFCMCPGGYVVNASSEEGRIAVNGMSYRARDGYNANSAIIVTVTPEDFGHEGVLGGVEFQRDLEHAAYKAGQGSIPIQLLGDFEKNQESTALGQVRPCTKGAWKLTNLRKALPEFLGDALVEGVHAFEKQIPGFAMPDA
ncbi:MAG: FAD-dependent oxidoreductase, partial [Eubacteriales bacterium]|nr:FAD-dependent oxidoreductase [Eubacteriales bacterium]